jgi:hypothetical protein
MRKLSIVLAAALATALPSLAVAGAAHAKPPQPRAELVAKSVTGSLSNGLVVVTAIVRNKGNRPAGASQTAFYLSTDGTQSTNDPALGTAKVGKIKPRKAKPVAGSFALPASVIPGTYRVLACADSGRQVKERKETNNCKASKGTVTVALTVAASAGPGGTVAASGVTGGSCAGTTCTFSTSASGTVTFTPTPSAGYRFGAWTGATCTGQTAGAGNAITFAKPTTSKACTATFVKQVTVTWTIGPFPFAGAVTGAASHGSCTATDPITGTGSCLVDAGVGTVELTASATPPFFFSSWSGPACNGTTSPNKMTFSSPADNKACSANFTP